MRKEPLYRSGDEQGLNGAFRKGSSAVGDNDTMTALDFGYPWWLSYGHLAIAAPVLCLLALGYWRRWPRWAMAALGLMAAWALAVFLLIQFGLGIDRAPALPTEAFLKSGEGRVLDIGAGTGRSTIMVLRARPRVTMVASDLFGDSFDHHFGHSEDPREPLRRNLQAAGVAGRATIETADMRKLPFEAASFDAIVSAYAVDHLNGAGIREALAEAARVVKPGGEFLLMLVGNDRWAKFAYGPLLTHGGTRGRAWWAARMQEAGFQLVEEGTTPGTLFFLARR